MRKVFCQTLTAAAKRSDFIFLTGDLGFMALEPLQSAMQERFLNVGIAEQNMASVAAGLARQGLRPWIYSIAAFLYTRPYEQIRNDICFHRLPVVIVGNGGGYGYGVMGATHHALEDYGSLLCLQYIHVYVPAFDDDIAEIASHLFTVDHPAYLRLGLSELPSGASAPRYEPWRRLEKGRETVVVGIGPIVGGVWAAVRELPEARRPTLWLVSELPLQALPDKFVDDVRKARHVIVVEEHVKQGGLGQLLACRLAEERLTPSRFRVCCARGYPSGRYGSQQFHRQECGIDAASILRTIQEEPPIAAT